MRALKVAWDNSIAGRDKAGTGVYATQLLQQYATRNDLHVTVLSGWSNSHTGSKPLKRGLGTLQDLLWMHAYLPAALWRKKVDVLHAPAFLAPLAAPCPVVVTVHDVSYLLFPSYFSRWWVQYLNLVMPRILASAAAIIAVSEHSKCDIIKFYGISPEKIRVIPHGVDHERFRPGAVLDAGWARSLGIEDGYVLHVGTLTRRKNIPTLIRAIAELRDRGEWGSRQLVLAGAENRAIQGTQEVLKTITALGLGSSVLLTGRIPDKYMPGLYAAATLVVMPSVYEGFGFPVLEAMACGTPVVCSDSSSLPEVGGNAGIYFPCQDHHGMASAIAGVLGSEVKAQEMRRKGLERASHFSWQRAANETIAVYREVTGL